MDRGDLSEAIIQEVSAIVAEESRVAGPELLTADLDGMEARLQQLSRRVCGSTLERVLAVRAIPQGERPPCPACGGLLRLVDGARGRDMQRLTGDATLVRPTYVCTRAGCGRGHAPLDAELGRGAETQLPRLARVVCRAGITGAFNEAATHLGEDHGVAVGGETVRRVTEAVGAVAEAAQQEDIDRAQRGDPSDRRRARHGGGRRRRPGAADGRVARNEGGARGTARAGHADGSTVGANLPGLGHGGDLRRTGGRGTRCGSACAPTPTRGGRPAARLTVVEGDATDAEAAEAVVRGADAVISVIGQTKGSPPDLQTTAARTIVAAMQRHGVQRLVSLTGAGVDAPQDRPTLLNHAIKLALKTVSGPALRDALGHVAIIGSSGLEWTIVRVPRLTDGPRVGRYRVGWVGVNTGTRIARADVADFLLE